MSERLIKTLDKLSHDMSIAELNSLYKNRETSDLSYHDTLYLNIIDAHPNKYTSSQIADILKITRPAVTQKINELAKKGYIIRTQSEQDKRVFYLSVDPTKSYWSDEDRKAEHIAAKKLEEKFGEKQVDILCDMLSFLAESIHDEMAKGIENE